MMNDDVNNNKDPDPIYFDISLDYTNYHFLLFFNPSQHVNCKLDFCKK
jgi:hypothetical protein